MATWLALPNDVWDAPTTNVSGVDRPLSALVGRRWQELEVHVIDLGIGPTYRDWSSDFVDARLPRMRAAARRDNPRIELPTSDAFRDGREELAWLYGRVARPDLPSIAPV